MKGKFFYPLLIFIVWLVAYIISQLLFDQKLGWDEVAYMSVAKGIADNFDFSARTYTVMGLIKHGYPTHFINFPIFPVYLAVFFKLFGSSLYVAYFANWLLALGVLLLLYFIFLMLSENNHKISFLVSMSYLFCPGILRNCDSAMMEQGGCFLLCLFVYFILKDYHSGKFNYFTVIKFAFTFLILWMYKSLYVGIFFGLLAFIFLAYNSKLSGKELNTRVRLPIFLIMSYGLFVLFYYLLSKFVFLPVAPMLTFTDVFCLSTLTCKCYNTVLCFYTMCCFYCTLFFNSFYIHCPYFCTLEKIKPNTEIICKFFFCYYFKL